MSILPDLAVVADEIPNVSLQTIRDWEDSILFFIIVKKNAVEKFWTMYLVRQGLDVKIQEWVTNENKHYLQYI